MVVAVSFGMWTGYIACLLASALVPTASSPLLVWFFWLSAVVWSRFS